jgi:hypothetical protein
MVDVIKTHEALQDSDSGLVSTKRAHTTQIPFDRLDVTVHVVSEQLSTSLTREDDLRISVDDQGTERRYSEVITLHCIDVG